MNVRLHFFTDSVKASTSDSKEQTGTIHASRVLLVTAGSLKAMKSEYNTIHQAHQEFLSIIRHFQQRTVNLSEVCTVGGLAWLTGRASGPLRTSSSTYQHCRFYKPSHLSTDSALCSILISPKFHPGERASRLLWTSRLQPSVDLETFGNSVGRFYTSQFVEFIHCSLLISTWFHPWEGHRTCFWKVVQQCLKKCSDIIWVRVTFLRK